MNICRIFFVFDVHQMLVFKLAASGVCLAACTTLFSSSVESLQRQQSRNPRMLARGEGERRKGLKKKVGFCVSIEIASRLFTPLFVRRSICGLS